MLKHTVRFETLIYQTLAKQSVFIFLFRHKNQSSYGDILKNVSFILMFGEVNKKKDQNAWTCMF